MSHPGEKSINLDPKYLICPMHELQISSVRHTTNRISVHSTTFHFLLSSSHQKLFHQTSDRMRRVNLHHRAGSVAQGVLCVSNIIVPLRVFRDLHTQFIVSLSWQRLQGTTTLNITHQFTKPVIAWVLIVSFLRQTPCNHEHVTLQQWLCASVNTIPSARIHPSATRSKICIHQ